MVLRSQDESPHDCSIGNWRLPLSLIRPSGGGGCGAGLERENHLGFAARGRRDAEPPEQKRRGDHVAHAAYFELRPVARFGPPL